MGEQDLQGVPVEGVEAINWIALLRGALMDEKAAPDILEFKDDILKFVSEMVMAQVEKVHTMRDNPDLEMERIIYERDLQRTNWLIKAYHRARIRKVEKHVQHYLHVPEYTKRMSPPELEYAKDYFTAIGRHAHQMVLKDLPQHFQSFTFSSAASQQEDMIPAPDTKRTVLMRPAFDSIQVPVSAENRSDNFADAEDAYGPLQELKTSGAMTVYQGDIVVVQYNLIQQQLLNEEVRLI